MSTAVVCLSGGVGGAKLLLGLQRILPAGALTAVVNTGDDFDHLGLRICPDIDTALYTLSGLANPELGWGRRDETWSFMGALESLGGDTWFRLGDADLALHVERTRRLARGETLERVTADVAARFGVASKVVPMSNDSVRTRVVTDGGELDFQDYFVRLRCQPAVRALRFDGAGRAAIAAGAIAALEQPLRAVLIAPSNPWLSIDPLLALPGLRALLRASGAPVIAVTPLIGGNAVKGPTAKIMRELGLQPSPRVLVAHYRGLLDGFLLDARDAVHADELGLPCATTDTLMKTLEDRERVAAAALALADRIAGRGA